MAGRLLLLLAGRLLLLLAVINVAVAQETPTYFKTGGNLTLDLRPPPAEKITNILWKFNGDLLAEWVENVVPLGYYDPFTGRTDLNINTGRLVIDKTTEADQGVYIVEVNNKVQSVRYKAILTEDPNKPEVHPQPLSCSIASPSCNMSCDTDTTKTGPLTYSWKEKGGEWKEAGTEKKLPITEAKHSHVETFTCRVKNPLGVFKESDPEKNPLFKEEVVVSEGLGGGAIVGIIFGVLCPIVVGLLVWKRKKLPCNNGVSYDTHERLSTMEAGKPDLPSNGDSTVQTAPGKEESNSEKTALNQPQEKPAAEEPPTEKSAAEEPAAKESAAAAPTPTVEA